MNILKRSDIHSPLLLRRLSVRVYIYICKINFLFVTLNFHFSVSSAVFMDILFIPLSLLCSTHFITLFLLFCRLYTPTLHFHGSERNFCPFYWISLSRKRFHSLSSPALRTRKMELSSCGWPKICRTRPDRSSISLDSSFVLFLKDIKGFWVLLGFNCSHPSFLLLIHMCSSTQSLFTCTGLLRHSLLIT